MATKIKATKVSSSGDAVVDPEVVDQAIERAHRTFGEATGAFTDSRDSLKRQLATNPTGVLAGAIAAGFIVGGGVFTPVAARLLKWTVTAAAFATLFSSLRNSTTWRNT